MNRRRSFRTAGRTPSTARHTGTPKRNTTTGIPHDKMGMWVFLCSEVMFFTGLIGAYIVLRFGTPDLAASGQRSLNIRLTAGNTFLLICSSVTMVQALARPSSGRRAEDEALPLA